MTNEQQINVTFRIQYNWPPNHASFDCFPLESKANQDNGIKYRVYAKEKDGEYRTFNESVNPLSGRDFNSIFSQKASNGIYLTGDEFLIEICNKEGKVLFGAKHNALSHWPVDAHGDSHTLTNYHLTFPKNK